MNDDQKEQAINMLCQAADLTAQQMGFTGVRVLMIVSYDDGDKVACAVAATTLCGDCLTDMSNIAQGIIQQGIEDGRFKQHGTDLREMSETPTIVH